VDGNWERQKDGVRKIRAVDISASIFLTIAFSAIFTGPILAQVRKNEKPTVGF
jgi:hypothetical protein